MNFYKTSTGERVSIYDLRNNKTWKNYTLTKKT